MLLMVLFIFLTVIFASITLYLFYGLNDPNTALGYFNAAVMSFSCYMALLSDRYKDMQIQVQKRQIELQKTLIALFEKENDRLRGIRK